MRKSIKKIISLVCVVCLVLAMGAPAFAEESVTATPTSAAVLVNGTNVGFKAYNINGNNYFKLRDIAKAISGTDKQFEVGVDGMKIVLTSGVAYTPVGGELSTASGTDPVSALLSSWSVYLDTEAVELTAYNIGGNNYFKLRDVANALDFGVGFDNASNTITIDTSAEYAVDNAFIPFLGTWSCDLAEGSTLLRFYGDGTYFEYDMIGPEASVWSAGTYTVSGSEVKLVDRDSSEDSDYSFKFTTASGKTTMALTGEDTTTFIKQDRSSIVGTWCTSSDTATIIYIFYSNGSVEAGTIDSSNVYTQASVGSYTLSENSLKLTYTGESMSMTCNITSINGRPALNLTDSDGSLIILIKI